MQLKTQTDYAIRVLLYLASKKVCVSTKEICASLGIAENYMPTRPLRDKGWISSSYGAMGGYTLIRNPKEITLLDVMEVMEDTVKMNRCLEGDEYCSRFAVGYCQVHKIYKTFQNFYEWYFSSITIADLLTPETAVDPTRKAVEQLIEKSKPIWQDSFDGIVDIE